MSELAVSRDAPKGDLPNASNWGKLYMGTSPELARASPELQPGEDPNHPALHSAPTQDLYWIHSHVRLTGSVRCRNNSRCCSRHRGPRFELSKQNQSAQHDQPWFLSLCAEGFDRCANHVDWYRRRRGLGPRDDNYGSKRDLASLVALKVIVDDDTISICLSMLNVRAKSGWRSNPSMYSIKRP